MLHSIALTGKDKVSVVQRVVDNCILRVEYGFKQATICIKTRGIQNRILCTEKAADPIFQFLNVWATRPGRGFSKDWRLSGMPRPR